ncbi:MAG: gliding motility protein GldC [Bacteroidetes bacterium]|nr:gliding motility protein GldC [Bacteroidota bacterium]MCL4815771.1 gliding motility protein GldC [Flavobacteriales bacterium]NOG95783.1 gliding motility protein GldC [Bacteroidota bacterium]WKZ74729.1 MAG: gliding motility protein GldC [Vicingaceae bacterium]GIK68756.1 MAG: gliding motility protein GldC [Bacteroidota bacterium]
MRMKNSEIKLNVGLDENNVPEKITWYAEDSSDKPAEAKGVMLTLWDKKENNTLRIDLWTKEMTVEEMRFFCCQTMLTLSDTFLRATGDAENASVLKEFAANFAKKLSVLK